MKKYTHKVNWLRKLKAQGQRPDILLIDIGDEHTYKDLECFHIRAHLQAGYDLTNASDGRVYTEHARASMAAAAHERELRKRRSHCMRKHELSGDNVYITPEGERRCRECQRIRKKNARDRHNPDRPLPAALRTHCPQGHPYDDENTGYSHGRRICRTCHRERARARRAS